MPETLDEIMTQLESLSEQDRAAIALRLLESLPREPSEFSSDEELMEEIQRRSAEIDTGVEEGISAEDAIRQARESLR